MNIVRFVSILAVLATLLGSILDLYNYRFGNLISIVGMVTMFIVLARWLEMTLKDVRNLRKAVEGDVLRFAKSTFKRVQNLPEGANQGHDVKMDANVTGTSQNEDKSTAFHRRPKVGRYSTPDVSNDAAKETIANLVLEKEVDTLAGIYDESAMNIEAVAHVKIRPGMAIQQLRQSSANYLVIDEHQLNRGQWYGALDASGTRLMRELLETIKFAISNGMATYIIHSAQKPDVNSLVLRSTKATQLPLTDEQLAESAGSNMSPILQHLQNLAKERLANP